MEYNFSADRPISSKTDDLLDRSNFADSLATAIKSWKEKDSLVIALYGAWGSGKSSLKNLVLESLSKDKGNCPLIVEFNPWQWAAQDQLTEAFFQEIGIKLGKQDKSKRGKKLATMWRTYGAYLKVGSLLFGGFRKVIVWLLVIIGGIGVVPSLIEITWLKPVIFVLSVIALVLAGAFKWWGAFAESVASAFEVSSETRFQGLPELKKELAGSLRKLTAPVLVVIDDIDRLSTGEIKQLFQLVKANADFPNLIYLLLFQRDIVEKSLEKLAPITGRDFLEKIVQVGFDIPQIERTKLEKVLLTGLDKLLPGNTLGQRFDQTRWGNIWVAGLRDHFQTLRDVHRFLNTLSFHVSVFDNESSFEVNPIDLIALEVLRVFEPGVYQQLLANKSVLTDLSDSSLKSQNPRDREQELVNSIVEKAPESNRTQVREILKQLFPVVEKFLTDSNIFGSISGADYADTWYRELRVCHPEVFDRYFLFNIPAGDISQAELDRVLSLVGDREKLVAEFRAFNERDILGVLLNRLEAYKQEIDLQYAVPFVTALFDIGDELPETPPGFYAIGPQMHASRIAYWYLIKESNIDRRGEILLNAIKKTTGLYLPLVMGLEMAGEIKNKEAEKINDLFVKEEVFTEMKKLFLQKIQEAAKSGALKSHPKMAYILYRWREWTSPEEPKGWIESLIKTDEGVLSLLKSFLQKSTSQTMGDYVSRTQWRIKLKEIEAFAPIEMIKEKLAQISIEDLEEKEKIGVEAFNKALKRKQEGRSDDDWRDDD